MHMAVNPSFTPLLVSDQRIGAMRLKPILLAIMFISMIGLAGCVDGAGHYGSYGYPSYGYYSSYGPWRGYGHRDFDHREHFDRDRFERHAFNSHVFGGAGFHNGRALGRGGGHFGGGGGHR
jgi:hypothetical protein